MKYMVDLNSDLGEGYGAYSMGLDSEVLEFVTSANIACGFHAGDPIIMDKTIKLAKQNGVSVGAHPGYPDLLGFGRRNLDLTREEARSYMLYQMGALQAIARFNGIELQHVKLHGAFYNTTSVNENLALGIIDGLLPFKDEVIFLALSGSLIAKLAEDKGLRVAHEVFADRAYNTDATLVNRKHPGAMIHDKDIAVARIKRMIIERKVEAIDGNDISIKADSICVHGDNPQAVDFVRYIRQCLESEGIEIKALHQFI